jgi:FixJ family two-component response regulator
MFVAVVDDDAPCRTALGRLLQARGFRPLLFESAEAYLAASPKPFCVVLDVRLPGMSGLDLQEHIQSRDAPPPIIVMTASREAPIRARAEQNGCVEFFWKPVDSDLLMATITALANRVLENAPRPS